MDSNNLDFVNLIVSHIQDSILLLNIHKIILFTNFENDSNIIGKNLSDFISKHHIKKFDIGFKDSILSKKSVNIEIKARFIQNRMKWFTCRLSSIIKENDVKSILVFISDISEKRKKMLKDKEEVSKKLKKANDRMKVLEKIIGLLTVNRKIIYKDILITFDEFLNNPHYRNIRIENIQIIDENKILNNILKDS